MASVGSFDLHMHRAGKPVEACLGFVSERGFPTLRPGMLTAEELAAFVRYQTPMRQITFLSGRVAAKEAVRGYLKRMDQPMNTIGISSGVFNQPIVKCTAQEKPEITISHTDALAVAIAHEPGHIMGIDIERLNQSRLASIGPMLTKVERELLLQVANEERHGLALLWTAKEALSKAIRCGLTVPVDVLGIREVKLKTDGSVIFFFENFAQYKCESRLLDQHALSIVLPRKTELKLECAPLLN